MRQGGSIVGTGRDGRPSAAVQAVPRQSGTQTSPTKANQGGIASLRLCDFAFEASTDSGESSARCRRPSQPVLWHFRPIRRAPRQTQSKPVKPGNVPPCLQMAKNSHFGPGHPCVAWGPSPCRAVASCPPKLQRRWMAKAEIVPNRAQSCPIVDNRGIFLFKLSFIPHLACPSRILPAPAIENDGRQGGCRVCVLLIMGYFPGDS